MKIEEYYDRVFSLLEKFSDELEELSAESSTEFEKVDTYREQQRLYSMMKDLGESIDDLKDALSNLYRGLPYPETRVEE